MKQKKILSPLLQGKFAENVDENGKLALLFSCLSAWRAWVARPVVLMIDEVDSATNNQVFLDFLAQLRGYFVRRKKRATFQSVILAGVYDIRNLKQKIRSDEEHKLNSPWNIAAEFHVNMSFSVSDIRGMLREYDANYSIGMNIDQMAALFYDYSLQIMQSSSPAGIFPITRWIM